MKCLVKKLAVVIDNENLPTLDNTKVLSLIVNKSSSLLTQAPSANLCKMELTNADFYDKNNSSLIGKELYMPTNANDYCFVRTGNADCSIKISNFDKLTYLFGDVLMYKLEDVVECLSATNLGFGTNIAGEVNDFARSQVVEGRISGTCNITGIYVQYNGTNLGSSSCKVTYNSATSYTVVISDKGINDTWNLEGGLWRKS